ncbi:MAG: SH3 domain-containing protein [Gammaproteobacteria bacterium]|nr:SH3 domain-containing protein [Gammaproteobacteria bacterium]MCI0591405.1 SH3 domain-containing protein [Gammaproteobacteria bacterium]
MNLCIESRMGRFIRLLVAAAFLVNMALSAAGEVGVTLFDLELKTAPDLDASSVAQVPKDTQVEILERKAAWLHVRVLDGGGDEGWVSTYDVRQSGQGTRTPQGGGTGLSRFLGMLFGEPGPHGPQVTSTIGIRGMDEADLAAAKPAPEEYAKLDKYKSSIQRASRLAQTADLKATKLDYLEPSDRQSDEH